MATTGLGYSLRENDWVRLRQILQQLSDRLGPTSNPIFAALTATTINGLTLSGTGSMDIAAGKTVDIDDNLHIEWFDWRFGTINQNQASIYVTSDSHQLHFTGTVHLDQSVETGSDVTFGSVNTLSISDGLIDFANTGKSLTFGGDYSIGQSLLTNSNVTFGTIDCTTLNTGQGANELYAMNQDVETTDAVTFADLDLSAAGVIDLSITSTDHSDIGISFMRVGAGFADWRMINIGGVLYIRRSTNDGANWGNKLIMSSTYTHVGGADVDHHLRFRDSAVYIASLTDGHLDLTADISIDLNANTDITGTIRTTADQDWDLGAAAAGAPTPDSKIRVTIGGADYDISAQAI